MSEATEVKKANVSLAKTLSINTSVIPVKDLVLNPDDPRFSDPHDPKLLSSLLKDGQADAGVVQRSKDDPTKWVVLSGNRRAKCLIFAQGKENEKENGNPDKYTFIAREFSGNEEQKTRLVSITNSFRKDWTLAQKAVLVNRMSAMGMTHNEVASALGMNTPNEVIGLSKLNQLDPDQAEKIFDAEGKGIIAQSTALALVKNPEKIQENIEKAEQIHKQEKALARKKSEKTGKNEKAKPVSLSALTEQVKVNSRIGLTDMTALVQAEGTPQAVKDWILANHFNDAEAMNTIDEYTSAVGLVKCRSVSAAEKALAKQEAAKAQESENEELESSEEGNEKVDE